MDPKLLLAAFNQNILQVDKISQQFFQSPAWFQTMAIIKIISFVISLILGIAILVLIIKSGAIKDQAEEVSYFLKPKQNLKNRFARLWEKVKDLLNRDYPEAWKLAIVEGVKIFDELLKKIGYEGKDENERLMALAPNFISHLEKLKEVYELKQKIINQTDYQISLETAQKTLEIIEEALKELEVLD